MVQALRGDKRQRQRDLPSRGARWDENGGTDGQEEDQGIQEAARGRTGPGEHGSRRRSDRRGWRDGVLGTRPSMRKITQHSVERKNLRIGDARQNTHRERERGTKTVFLIKSATVTKTTNTLQKVTKSLYIVTNLGQLPFMLFT